MNIKRCIHIPNFKAFQYKVFSILWEPSPWLMFGVQKRISFCSTFIAIIFLCFQASYVDQCRLGETLHDILDHNSGFPRGIRVVNTVPLRSSPVKPLLIQVCYKVISIRIAFLLGSSAINKAPMKELRGYKINGAHIYIIYDDGQ